MVSYILITEYSILLFMNPLNFKLLQVPAVLFYTFPTACRSELCQRFLKIKNVWKIKKNVKNVNNVTKIKKNVKNVFLHLCFKRSFAAPI